MNIWQVIGIEPTKDVGGIKKAYAQKLRLHHPEDDPQGYQRLREAYDLALKYAKVQEIEHGYEMFELLSEKNPDGQTVLDNSSEQNDKKAAKEEPAEEILEERLVEEIPDEVPKVETPYELSEVEDPDDWTAEEIAEEEFSELSSMNGFMARLEALYNDFFSRIDADKWQQLLNCDTLWDFYMKDRLRYQVLVFLTKHRYLPQNIWRILDENFQWTSYKFYKHHNFKEILDYMEKQLYHYDGLGFFHFKPVENVDFDVYLKFREQAFSAIEEDNLETASLYLNQAKQIYNGDPELLLIEAECAIHGSETDEALSILDELLAAIPDHIAALKCRARIHEDLSHHERAAEDYKKLMELVDENYSWLVKLAKCYYKMADYESARTCFIIALKIRPDDKEVNILLGHVNKILIKNLTIACYKNWGDTSLKLQLQELRQEAKQLQRRQAIKKQKFKFKLSVYGLYAGCLLAVVFGSLFLGIFHGHAPQGVSAKAISVFLDNAGQFDTNMARSMEIKDLRQVELVMMGDSNRKLGKDSVFLPMESDSKLTEGVGSIWCVYIGTYEQKDILIISHRINIEYNSGVMHYKAVACPAPPQQIFDEINKVLVNNSHDQASLRRDFYLAIDN